MGIIFWSWFLLYYGWWKDEMGEGGGEVRPGAVIYLPVGLIFPPVTRVKATRATLNYIILYLTTGKFTL